MLRELQTRMMHALACMPSADPSALADAATLIALPAAAATARLHIYRNTIESNAVASLESNFPALRRLVGDDYFRQIALEYLARHPSRSGDLQPLGNDFPAFIAGRHATDEFAYLGDVARFEWLLQAVLLAPEHAPLDLDKLAGVAPAAYDSLCFVLHPALRIFDSPYPVQRIWAANVGDDEPEHLDLREGGGALAVMRQRLQLEFHPLTRGEHRWLAGLERGEPFATTLANAAACDGDFDATAALQRFVGVRAIVDFR